MKDDKTLIIENIHTLVSHNVIGHKQCLNRHKGFRAELSFAEEVKYPKYKFLKGGVLISKSSSDTSLNDSIYYTIIDETTDNKDYINLYIKLSALHFIKMFLVIYKNSWSKKPVMLYETNTIELPVPDFEIFLFNIENKEFISQGSNIETIRSCFKNIAKRPKNHFPVNDNLIDYLKENISRYSFNALQSLYVDRLVFDGYLGFSVEKGKPSDIDLIALNDKGNYLLIEIKEKDLPKQAKQGFGLDEPRIKDFSIIEEKTEIPYCLFVRHITDQDNRNLVGWKYVTIKDFVEDTKNSSSIEGGTGMRSSYSSNPTKICSLSKFKDAPK